MSPFCVELVLFWTFFNWTNLFLASSESCSACTDGPGLFTPAAALPLGAVEVEGAIVLSFDRAFLASVDSDSVGVDDFGSENGFFGGLDGKALPPPATGFRLANGGRFGSVDDSLGLEKAEAMAPTLPGVETANLIVRTEVNFILPKASSIMTLKEA